MDEPTKVANLINQIDDKKELRSPAKILECAKTVESAMRGYVWRPSSAKSAVAEMDEILIGTIQRGMVRVTGRVAGYQRGYCFDEQGKRTLSDKFESYEAIIHSAMTTHELTVSFKQAGFWRETWLPVKGDSALDTMCNVVHRMRLWTECSAIRFYVLAGNKNTVETDKERRFSMKQWKWLINTRHEQHSRERSDKGE